MTDRLTLISLRRIAIGLMPIAIAGAMVLPFVLLNRQLLFNLDNVHQTYVWWQYAVREIQAWRVPLWNPYPASGMTNVGEGQMFALYPISAIWILLLGPLAGSQTSIVLFAGLHAAILAYGLYALLRAFSAPRYAAWFASAVGTLSGAFMYRSISQLNIYWAMSWVPLAVAIVAYSLFENRPRAAALGGGILALSIYAGHFQGAILAVPILVVLAFMQVLGSRNKLAAARQTVLASIWFGGAAVICALPQIWATIEYMPTALRFVSADRPYSGLEKLPYSVVASNPHFGFESWPGIVFGNQQPTLDGSLFVGIPVAVLAFGALLKKAPHRMRRLKLFSLIGIVSGIVLSLGPNTPALKIWLLIPGVSVLREPTRYDVWFAIGAVGLAAVGLVHAMAMTKWKQIALVAVVSAGTILSVSSIPERNLLLVGLLCSTGLVFLVRPSGIRTLTSIPFGFGTASLLAAMPLLVTWVIILPSRDAPAETVSTPQNTFTEQLQAVWSSLPDPAISSESTARVIPLTEGVPPNSGTLYQRLSTSSYSATIPTSTYETLNSPTDWETALNLKGVQFVIDRNALGELQVTSRDGTHPFAWFAHPFPNENLSTVHDAVAHFTSPSDVYNRTFVSQAELPDGCVGNAVKSVVTTNSAGLTFTCPSGGTLVTALDWDKNWVATGDGRTLEVIKANASMLAIVVPTGTEAISLNYQPGYWSPATILLVFGGVVGLGIISFREYRYVRNSKSRSQEFHS